MKRSERSSSFEFEPIGFIETPFKQKFGIPRQPGLCPSARGRITVTDHPFFRQALRDLDRFSHLWLIFVFHAHDAKNWKPSIRPPRLGGAKKTGVLASRSPHRPNPIGLSLVKLRNVNLTSGQPPRIEVEGVDLLDQTPILDIKPYLPYADQARGASSGWAAEPIKRYRVRFTSEALSHLKTLPTSREDFRYHQKFIREILSLDPRPAFQQKRLGVSDPLAQGTTYGIALYDYDVKFRIEKKGIVVYGVTPLTTVSF